MWIRRLINYDLEMFLEKYFNNDPHIIDIICDIYDTNMKCPLHINLYIYNALLDQIKMLRLLHVIKADYEIAKQAV